MFWKNLVRDLRRAGISRRLVVYIIMCSTAIALLATAVQLYFDYTTDLEFLDQRLDQVEDSFGESISDSLWNIDYDQVEVVIEGILRLPDIEYVRVKPSEETIEITTGKRRSQYTKIREYTLNHRTDSNEIEVGRMLVEASLTGIFKRLKQKFFLVLITQGIKTFLVAMFMFIIFNALIIRHLDTISIFARSLKFGGTEPSELILDRPSAGDEIDDVVDAINHMQTDLFTTYQDLVQSNVALDERTQELKNHQEGLERLVDERTAELKKAQQILLDQAHQAGMAEIATGVLHNVGNSLNSLNISCQLVQERISSSSLRKLEKTDRLIEETRSALMDLDDSRLSRLPDYLVSLCRRLVDDRDTIKQEVQRMQEHLAMVRGVVKDQQAYADFSSFEEKVQLGQLIKDVVRLESVSLQESQTSMSFDLADAPSLMLPKAKVSYALLHILKNAHDAVIHNAIDDRQIQITLSQQNQHIQCAIRDNGKGIDKADIEQIFQFGFSTKGSGRGFGLHTCSLVMTELKGDIFVTSRGPGKGSIFTLSFPLPTSTDPV